MPGRWHWTTAVVMCFTVAGSQPGTYPAHMHADMSPALPSLQKAEGYWMVCNICCPGYTGDAVNGCLGMSILMYLPVTQLVWAYAGWIEEPWATEGMLCALASSFHSDCHHFSFTSKFGGYSCFLSAAFQQYIFKVLVASSCPVCLLLLLLLWRLYYLGVV